MRPHPITVALALVGVGITVTFFFMQAMRMELSPLGLRIGLGVGISCIVVAVALFVYGLSTLPVEGVLSRKARRELRGLRREIRGIVRAFKRWDDLPLLPEDRTYERLEQCAALEAIGGWLDQWVRVVREWCREHRPQAAVTFWNAPQFRAKLKLAEYYAEQVDQVRSEIRRERAGLKGRLGLILNKLGELHHQGLRFANQLSSGYFLGGNPLKLDLLEDIQEWSKIVELYLRDHPDLGLSYSSRFANNAPFPEGGVPLEAIIVWRQDWEAAVRRRCDNLSALISGLEQRRNAS